MYARADNFVGCVLYDDLREAYLHPEAAAALVAAQRKLKQLRPDLSLKVYDAARPMCIQQKMWNQVKKTAQRIYVSNPAHGGRWEQKWIIWVVRLILTSKRNWLPKEK